MRADIDGGNDGAVVAFHRNGDRAEMRLGLAVDKGITALTVGGDGGKEALRVGHSVARQRLALYRGESCLQLGITVAAEQRTANGGAEARQAIANIDAAREHPCRAAPRDEHDLLAVEQGERRDL